MARWGMLVAGAVLVAGAAFVTGTTVPPRDDADARAAAKVGGVVTTKTGYVNIARVMQNYERYRRAGAKLNGRREKMAQNVIYARAMHMELQGAVQRAADPGEKDRIGRELITLARWIEDTDRDLGRQLNTLAQAHIVEMFKEIRATAGEMAKENGLAAVHLHPGDPNTVNPAEMELLLKPNGLHPIYVDPAVDYTDELIKRLNEKFVDDGE